MRRHGFISAMGNPLGPMELVKKKCTLRPISLMSFDLFAVNAVTLAKQSGERDGISCLPATRSKL